MTLPLIVRLRYLHLVHNTPRGAASLSYGTQRQPALARDGQITRFLFMQQAFPRVTKILIFAALGNPSANPAGVPRISVRGLPPIS
jgi:hypothetical protein